MKNTNRWIKNGLLTYHKRKCMGHSHVNQYWLWSAHTECKLTCPHWLTDLSVATMSLSSMKGLTYLWNWSCLFLPYIIVSPKASESAIPMMNHNFCLHKPKVNRNRANLWKVFHVHLSSLSFSNIPWYLNIRHSIYQSWVESVVHSSDIVSVKLQVINYICRQPVVIWSNPSLMYFHPDIVSEHL